MERPLTGLWLVSLLLAICGSSGLKNPGDGAATLRGGPRRPTSVRPLAGVHPLPSLAAFRPARRARPKIRDSAIDL